MNPLREEGPDALACNAVFQQWKNPSYGTVGLQTPLEGVVRAGGLPAGKRPGGATTHGLVSGTVQVLGALTCIQFHGKA